MPEKNYDEHEDPAFAQLGVRLVNHIETQTAYLRLVLTEKLGLTLTRAISSGVTVLLLLLFLLFAGLTAGFWIGKIYNDNVIGFGVVGGFYLLVLLVYLALRKRVFEKRILDAVITSLCAGHENEDDDDEA